MVSDERTLKVKLLGDARSALKAIGKTQGKLGKFGTALKKLGKFAAIGAAGLVAAFALIGPKIFSAGANLELLQQKIQTVFGDSLPIVQKWAKANAAAMGITRTQAAGLAAGLGDLLVPMGFTRDQAAGMSTDIIGLSGALAEWSGGQRSAGEVAEILSKAMLGERDSLKSLGISITEADVKARLLKNGTADLTGELLQQAKALATQELLFEKSTDAQAKFAEGGDGAFRAQQKFKAAIAESKEAMLVLLMPALTKVAAFLSTKAAPALQRVTAWLEVKMPRAVAKLSKWFAQNRPQIEQFFERVRVVAERMFKHFKSGLEVIGPLLFRFGKWIITNKPALVAALIAIGVAVVLAMGPASLAVAAILGIITAIGWLRDNWDEVLAFIRGKVAQFVAFITSPKGLLAIAILLGPAGLVIVALIKFRNEVRRVFDFVIGKVQALINIIRRIPKPDLGFVGDIAGAAGGLLGRIPGRRHGGVIPGPVGAPRLAVVHGGETVVPTRRRAAAGGGGAGNTFVFAPQIAGSLYTEQQLRELFLRWVREAAQGGSFIGTPLVAG